MRGPEGHPEEARAKCLAATGVRPSQLGRIERHDIRPDDEVPMVIVAKPGKRGNARPIPLDAFGVATFQSLIDADALGKFSTSSSDKSWKLTCEQAGIPFFNPYKLRHTWHAALGQ